MFDSMVSSDCHYDKRSKGIISSIGTLEKPLILPNFAKICTFNFRNYSMFRRTSWYHSVRLIVSRLRLRSKVNLRTFILLAIISPT